MKRMSDADCIRSRPTGTLNLPAVTMRQRLEARHHERIENDRAAAGEVRHEAQVVDVGDVPSSVGRTRRKSNGIGGLGRDVVSEAATVEMEHAAELDDVGAVRRIEREAAAARLHDRRGLGGILGGLFLQLELALEDQQTLLLLFELLLECGLVRRRHALRLRERNTQREYQRRDAGETCAKTHKLPLDDVMDCSMPSAAADGEPIVESRP